VPDRSTRTFHGDIAVLLDALAGAGFGCVLARELDASAFEVAVARVLVPGLEPYLFPWVGYGDRARSFDAAAYVPD
jgi:ribosomal protein S12 methylthiotransferase accessory factor YcaO